MNALAAAWSETGSAIWKRYTPTWNRARNYFRANSRTRRKLLRCLHSILGVFGAQIKTSMNFRAPANCGIRSSPDQPVFHRRRYAVLAFNRLIAGLIAHNTISDVKCAIFRVCTCKQNWENGIIREPRNTMRMSLLPWRSRYQSYEHNFE